MEAGRFRWFGNNQFFANSSLTGLLFINEAKSKLEKLFWYCFLLVFAIVTIGNAVTFVKYYKSRPTQTVARVATSSEDVTLPAMRLEVTTSLDLFGLKWLLITAPSIDGFICNNTQRWLMQWRLDENQYVGVSGAEVANENALPILIDFCHNLKNTGPRASDILGQINQRSFLLRTVFETHRNTSLRTYGREELGVVSENMFDAFEQIEEHLVTTQVYLSLLFLEQLNRHSSDSQRLLLDKSIYFEELEKSQMTIKQLLEAVDTCFKEYLIVEAEQANAQVAMRDWTVNLTAGTQTIVYDISFDADSRAKRTTINVYATRLNRFLVMIREILLHLTRTKEIWVGNNDLISYECHNCWAEFGGQCQHTRQCDTSFNEWMFKTAYERLIPNTTYSKNKYIELIERYIERYTVRPVLENIEKNTRLKISLPHGRVDVLPLHQTNVTLQISGRFVALLDRCTNYTTAQCVDSCLYEQHLASCGCYPWTLRHVHNATDDPICTEPCGEAQQIYTQCFRTCNEEFGQACETTLMYGQVASIPLQHATLEWVTDEQDVPFWVLFTDPLLPIASIDVNLKDDRYYAVYVEKYSMTLNEFVAQFGGLLEFWLGINITGMIHLLFYVVRQAYRVRDKGSKTNRDWRRFLGIKPIDRETQKQKIASLNEIVASNEEIKKEILSLQETNIESGNLRLKTTWKQGISRLFKSSFLEETPLVGFSFIYNAKSKIEAYFWCLIILVFFVVTVRNLIIAGQDYSQGGTKTSLQMLYSEQKCENITLSVTTSVYEFINSVPITLRRYRIGGNRTNRVYFDVQNVPCIQASNDMMDKIATPGGQRVLIEKIEQLLQNQETVQPARWKKWKKRVEISQNLQVFWEAFRWHIEDPASNIMGPLADAFVPYEKGVFEAEILEAILKSMHDQELTKDADDVILALFMQLELMDKTASQKINYLLHNVGPDHLIKALSGADMHIIRDLRLAYDTKTIVDSFDQYFNVTLADSQMLAGRSLSVRDVVRLTESLIPLFLDIRTNNPSAKLDLRRVSFVPNGRMRMTFQVSVADGAQTDRIKLQIHSFQLARSLFYLESMSSHLVEYSKLEQRGKCSDLCHQQLYCSPIDSWYIYDSEYDSISEINGWAISEFLKFNDRQISSLEILWDGVFNILIQHVRAIHLLYKNAVTDLLNHYKETTSIWLTTQSGVTVFEPFWYHQSTLVPSTDFESNIHNCYAGTRDHCTQSCLPDAHLESCNCAPWHLHYLNPRGRICDQPCRSAQAKEHGCVEKCIQLTSHQCSIPMRREERSRQPITHFKLEHRLVPMPTYELEHEDGYDAAVVQPTLPLASIELRLGKLQHPCITEEYAMSRSGFISRLGGLMEIWLGFNIVALMHLFIYTVRHCRRITKQQSKAGRIMRQIVGEEELAVNPDSNVYETHEDVKEKWAQLQAALQP